MQERRSVVEQIDLLCRSRRYARGAFPVEIRYGDYDEEMLTNSGAATGSEMDSSTGTATGCVGRRTCVCCCSVDSSSITRSQHMVSPHSVS